MFTLFQADNQGYQLSVKGQPKADLLAHDRLTSNIFHKGWIEIFSQTILNWINELRRNYIYFPLNLCKYISKILQISNKIMLIYQNNYSIITKILILLTIY